MGVRSRGLCVLAAVAVTLLGAPANAGPPLRRDLASYVVFGLRSVGLKNLTVAGACNTGVNCVQPATSSSCGVINHENPLYGDGSQIAGDVARFSKGGGIIYQLFSNKPSGLGNVFINEPPVTSPDPLPILGDANANGVPSCRTQGGQCIVDAGDLEAACGFPTQFPACGATKVTVLPNSDCIGAPDADPGNGWCDLAAGTYGDLDVQNGAKLALAGGTYAFCKFQFGQSTETIAVAPAVVYVNGELRINNGSIFGPPVGTGCGRITVQAKGNSTFTFGRNATINGYFCAPERTLFLGHNNNLSGRFFGDTINVDSNNRAFCCDEICVEPPPPTDPALRRTLDAYFLLAQRRASLKNLSLGTPCNIGVNCADAGGGRTSCGVLAMGAVTAVDYSQLVGDQSFFRKPGARVWQLFRNNDSPLGNVELVAPPPNPQSFAPPVIPGTCDDSCTPNPQAMKAVCGFPTPFPACDQTKLVRAPRNADCPPYDTVPGNQQCDLPPGTYGLLVAQNGSRLNLRAGDYRLCGLRAGRRARITGSGTRILIPDGGIFRASNGSEVGEGCGDLTVLMDGSKAKVGFGRGGLVAAKICAPQAKMSLGHHNVLIGQFVADSVTADLNNVAKCCGVCP